MIDILSIIPKLLGSIASAITWLADRLGRVVKLRVASGWLICQPKFELPLGITPPDPVQMMCVDITNLKKEPVFIEQFFINISKKHSSVFMTPNLSCTNKHPPIRLDINEKIGWFINPLENEHIINCGVKVNGKFHILKVPHDLFKKKRQ